MNIHKIKKMSGDQRYPEIMKGLLLVVFIHLSFIASAVTHSIVKDGFQANQQINHLEAGAGNIIIFDLERATDEQTINLGKLDKIEQFSSVFRHSSCWMTPRIGENFDELFVETQFLIADIGARQYIMLIPLVDGKVRCSFSGNVDNDLLLVMETGDSLTRVKSFKGIYMLKGDNPQQMIKEAMKDIQSELQTFELKERKKYPWLIDYFGWCTWNALDDKVNEHALINAFESFKKKQIPVKYIIIDNGWQSTEKTGTLMNGYSANEKKFPKGIGHTANLLKNKYGVEKILVWHALWGTFHGIDPRAFPDMVDTVSFLPPPRMKYLLTKKDIQAFHYEAIVGDYEARVGPDFYPPFIGSDLTIPQFIPFLDGYYNYLRNENIDGVKIDAITWIEGVGNGRGGRVAAMQNLLKATEAAANRHFNNEIIYCSACSNDYLFNAVTANVTRSSTDFFPDIPASHGNHVFTNAHTSFWMGEIVMPDWDMFQSGHENGSFHAAARALSGGPVYTTDEIGTENREVLMKLMTEEGRLPRAKAHGKVCTSSLFTDPKDNEMAIKIFNTNLVGGVIGAFNCSYDAQAQINVKETISSKDIESLEGEKFAVYQYSTGDVLVQSENDQIEVNIPELEFDIFTYVPIQDGFAPLGVVDKYNPVGMILSYNKLTPNIISIDLMGGGNFIAYVQNKPEEVFINAKKVKYNYDDRTKVLSVLVPLSGEANLVIKI